MRRFARRRPLVSFFVLAFAITWGLDALRLRSGVGGIAGALLLQVAGAGPSLAGLFVAWAACGLRDLFGRVLKWRLGPGWYLLVLIVFPALLVGVIAAATILSGETFRLAISWWLLPAFMLLVLFLGPLPEELGWRAFALPALMDRYGWLPAGLVLGGVWALWHRTPAAWLEPLGAGGLGGLFLGAVLPDVCLSVLMAWVFLRTGGSALLAGLGMHTAANFALFVPAVPGGQADPATTWAITSAFAGCLAVLAVSVVILEWLGGRSPTRGGSDDGLAEGGA